MSSSAFLLPRGRMYILLCHICSLFLNHLRSIPERELEVRKDLRAERIFTIDPESAKDLDDALSIKANEDGTYEIGVHIADVSFFVKPNTALDRDARKRATSVYLVQRAVPMLPPTLCEELCSLNPGQERLAFSVFFTVTKDARILNKSFAKTIIKYASYSPMHHLILLIWLAQVLREAIL
jgi:protein SSD1